MNIFPFLDMYSPVFFITGIFVFMIFGTRYVNRQNRHGVGQ